jgi:hypothetical protein
MPRDPGREARRPPKSTGFSRRGCAGHSVHLEHPAALLKIVEDFPRDVV